MEKKFRSIVDELFDHAPQHHCDAFIESRATQVIASASNLLGLMRETFEPAVADDLAKRLLRAIASGEPEKFNRKMRVVREARASKDRRS